MKSWDRKLVRIRWICRTDAFAHDLAAQGISDLNGLSTRSLGEPVTDRRSSWVRRWKTGTNDYYIKTYDYPTWRDRSRGLGRTTLLARSRAAREAAALRWLRAHRFGGPEVCAVAEARTLGILTRAVLVTEAWPGQDLTRVAPGLDERERRGLQAAVVAFVRALHQAGFRDRNLDLRNLLARGGDSVRGWELAKIDSPRFRLTRPGRVDDGWAHADWERLIASWRAEGLAWDARADGGGA